MQLQTAKYEVRSYKLRTTGNLMDVNKVNFSVE